MISRNRDQCIEQVTKRTEDQAGRLVAAGADPGSPAVRLVLDQGDGASAQCREEEANAQAQVAAQERVEYQREAQAERERAALMATLITSSGH
jgi:hypothetical protein